MLQLSFCTSPHCTVLYCTPLYRQVAMTVQDRFGKHLLELGGNNCLIVAEDAEVRWRVCTVYSVQYVQCTVF